MPLVELSMTKGALSKEALAPLAERITLHVLRAQGARPGSDAARSISRVVFRQAEPDLVFVGGEVADNPLYRIIVTTPEGALDAPTKVTLVEELTKVVLDAEGTPYREAEAERVWCVINEIPDGNWGSGGKIYPWRDIQKWVVRRDFLAKRQARKALEQAKSDHSQDA